MPIYQVFHVCLQNSRSLLSYHKYELNSFYLDLISSLKDGKPSGKSITKRQKMFSLQKFSAVENHILSFILVVIECVIVHLILLFVVQTELILVSASDANRILYLGIFTVI